MTNETKEISILKRNLRLIKRIILGKKRPPLFFRIVAISSMFWSFLIIITLLGLLFLLTYATNAEVLEDLSPIDNKFYISFIGLHFFAIVSVVLMWRKINFGFYLFIITNLLMPFWISFFLPVFTFNVYWLIPSLLFIVLFGLNWRHYNPKKQTLPTNDEVTKDEIPNADAKKK